MILSELANTQVTERLRREGVCLRMGPFRYAIRTSLPAVTRSICRLYADFPVVEDGQFADFHVSLQRPANLRRWLLPEGTFTLDGQQQFDTFQLHLAPIYFEWRLNWCISQHAHHLLLLHAASLERDGRGLVIVGPSGMGKSTLCAGLALSGWRLLSDEFALLEPHDGRLLALARPISLKNESIDLIRALAPQAEFGPVCKSPDKGLVGHMKPPAEAVRRMTETCRPAWFVLLDWKPDQPARLQPVSKARTMMRIAAGAFNYGILGERGFTALARAIDQSQCLRFSYSRLDDAVAVFDNEPFAGNSRGRRTPQEATALE